MDVLRSRLKAGDCLINDRLTVERKSGRDFVRSIIDGRLFKQCRSLQQNGQDPVMIIEGAPLPTPHDIHPNAVRGAMLSISVCWRIPILNSEDERGTARLLKVIGHQVRNEQRSIPVRRGYKPKRLQNRQLFFLQGLPGVGPDRAVHLMRHFGDIESVLIATKQELKQVDGIGESTAGKIREVLTTSPGDV